MTSDAVPRTANNAIVTYGVRNFHLEHAEHERNGARSIENIGQD